MISFIAVIFILLFVALLSDETPSFGKDKMLPLKAILAIIIVADHLTFHVDATWLMPMRKWGAPIVSLFLFVSGYGLVKSYQAKGESYLKGFFSRRVWRVICPAVVAVILYLSLLGKWSGLWDYMADLFLYGIPILPYSWYVMAIVLLYAIFWLVYKIIPDVHRLWFMWLCCFLLGVTFVIMGYDRCWWICLLAFPSGVSFAHYEQGFLNQSAKRKSFLLIIAMCIISAAFFFAANNVYLYAGFYVFMPLAISLIITRLKLEALNSRLVVFIGTLSFEIYLCQGIAMECLDRVGWFLGHNGLYIILTYSLTIGLAYFVNRLSSLVLNRE